MLADERQRVRLRALTLISCSIVEQIKQQNFAIPKINPEAKDYTEMIILENELTIPSLLKGTTNFADIEQVPP